MSVKSSGKLRSFFLARFNDCHNVKGSGELEMRILGKTPRKIGSAMMSFETITGSRRSRKAHLKKFVSGLISTDYFEYPEPPFIGNGWRITYRPDPWERCGCMRGQRVYKGREIIINAANQVTAQKTIGLIHASLILLWNDPLLTNVSWRVEELAAENRSSSEGERPLFQRSTSEIPVACLIAVKASRNRHLIYALHKFLLSCQIYCPDSRSLDPSENILHKLSKFADDHVRFAYSIIAAYSVIEELGLEIRLSKEHPSSYLKGHWDPVVKADLESRLRDSDINLREKVLWHLRGVPSRLERLRQPRSQGKFSWARGSVRDCQMEVVDAIAHASWLRSRVSSHKLTSKVASLSVYDVANVQDLARRLLLETLGFWRYFEREEI